MNAILKRLERDWNLASGKKKNYRALATIVRLWAQNVENDRDAIRKLGKYVAAIEENLSEIPLKELGECLRAIKYARRILHSAAIADTGRPGRNFTAKLSASDKRRASRTLNHVMVKNLKNAQLAVVDDYDFAAELRDDMLDSDQSRAA